MKCSRQKEQPSSEPAADSSQSETPHRTVSAIAGHPRREKLTNILAPVQRSGSRLGGGRREERRKRGHSMPMGNARSESRLAPRNHPRGYFQSAVSGTY